MIKIKVVSGQGQIESAKAIDIFGLSTYDLKLLRQGKTIAVKSTAYHNPMGIYSLDLELSKATNGKY